MSRDGAMLLSAEACLRRCRYCSSCRGNTPVGPIRPITWGPRSPVSGPPDLRYNHPPWKPNHPPAKKPSNSSRNSPTPDKALNHAGGRGDPATRTKRGQDEQIWGIVGLIHDLDYEQFPEPALHKDAGDSRLARVAGGLPFARWSRTAGAVAVTSNRGRRWRNTFSQSTRLTGLVAAAALVRPSKSVLDLEVRSVKKKWKEKSFAAGVDRSVIERGAAMLGVALDA